MRAFNIGRAQTRPLLRHQAPRQNTQPDHGQTRLLVRPRQAHTHLLEAGQLGGRYTKTKTLR